MSNDNTKHTDSSTSSQVQSASHTRKSIILGISFVALAMLLLAASGYIFFGQPEDIITGQVEVEEVRIAGKVPGRISEFLVQEGQQVRQGDTLVRIYSPEVLAKLEQAEAAKSAAEAQHQKALAGARQEQKEGASRSPRRASPASSASTRRASSPRRSTMRLRPSCVPCRLPSVLPAVSTTWR